MSKVCGIKEIVEDVIDNGSLTKEDIELIDSLLSDDTDVSTLIEIMSITEYLDWNEIHSDFSDLLHHCIIRCYAISGIINERDAIQLISLFNPDEEIDPFSRKALASLRNITHGKTLRDFLDDNMI